MNKILGLSSLVGNTPLLAISCVYKGEKRKIYAKAENMNMTESIKDRMAFHILSMAMRRGLLKEGDKIAEATSGNTGISFAAIGRALGHEVTIFMPEWMSDERKNLIRSLGANIRLVSKEEGGFVGSIAMAEEMAEKNANVFLPRQFSNEDNIDAHYTTTGPEIWWQLRYRSLTPDAFVAGVGTGGTVMGVGRFLKEQNSKIKVHPLEPSNSPTMSTGHRVGKHRIQGISDEFIPDIVNLDQMDEIVSVDDGDAIIMAQKLSMQLGIGVGISSGANFLGALKVQDNSAKDAVVVTVFPDSNKKYLSTNLMDEEPVKEGFMAPDVRLENFRAFKRVCHTCCDPTDCVEHKYKGDDIAFQLPYCARRGGH
jgi:cysteine synthase A